MESTGFSTSMCLDDYFLEDLEGHYYQTNMGYVTTDVWECRKKQEDKFAIPMETIQTPFYVDQELIAEYFNKIQTIEKVLRTLTPRFDHIIVAINELEDLEAMFVEKLQNSLKEHE